MTGGDKCKPSKRYTCIGLLIKNYNDFLMSWP